MEKGNIKLDHGTGTMRVEINWNSRAISQSGARLINPETGTGWTRAELLDGLRKVEDQSNWKLPLPGRLIHESDACVVLEAVRFFLGGMPMMELDMATDCVKVTGAGYYKWIGA